MTKIVRLALLSGTGAVLLGGLIGLTTVNGLRGRTLPATPIYPRSPTMAAADPDYPVGTDCAGCTTYDAGYRWASTQHVDTADACFGDDWAYQRGCLAFVQGTRLD